MVRATRAEGGKQLESTKEEMANNKMTFAPLSSRREDGNSATERVESLPVAVIACKTISVMVRR